MQNEWDLKQTVRSDTAGWGTRRSAVIFLWLVNVHKINLICQREPLAKRALRRVLSSNEAAPSAQSQLSKPQTIRQTPHRSTTLKTVMSFPPAVSDRSIQSPPLELFYSNNKQAIKLSPPVRKVLSLNTLLGAPCWYRLLNKVAGEWSFTSHQGRIFLRSNAHHGIFSLFGSILCKILRWM